MHSIKIENQEFECVKGTYTGPALPNGETWQLHYTVSYPEQQQSTYRTALCVHGYGGSEDSIYITKAKHALLSLGYAVITCNYSDMIKQNNRIVADTHYLTPSHVTKSIHHVLHEVDDKHGKNLDLNNILVNATSYGTSGAYRYNAHEDRSYKSKVFDDDPYHFSGMILQSPVLNPMEPYLRKMTPWKRAQLWAWQKVEHVTWNIAGDPLPLYCGVYHECKDLVVSRDITPHVNAPSFIVYGEQDGYIDQEDIKLIQKSRKTDVELLSFADAGHALQIVPKVEKLANDLIAKKLGIDSSHITRRNRSDYLIQLFLQQADEYTYMNQALEHAVRFVQRKNLVPNYFSGSDSYLPSFVS
jgi:pimeloyl-ACP methyl ester carboxylesterase